MGDSLEIGPSDDTCELLSAGEAWLCKAEFGVPDITLKEPKSATSLKCILLAYP
jgi:hypothetical protein